MHKFCYVQVINTFLIIISLLHFLVYVILQVSMMICNEILRVYFFNKLIEFHYADLLLLPLCIEGLKDDKVPIVENF